MPRADGRKLDELRPLGFERGFIGNAAGSCLVTCGRTRVICTASVEEGAPAWLRGRGRGWLTAEYAMLPGSTGTRKPREGRRGRPDGRSVEIQRLIGRALRQSLDLALLGERTITLDCDVIEADGGTRSAAINGAWIALHDALAGLERAGTVARSPLRHPVAAISVGVVDDRVLLDLDYGEDSGAAADMNVVMDGAGGIIEVQAAGERRAFTARELTEALDLARRGIEAVHAGQRAAVAEDGA